MPTVMGCIKIPLHDPREEKRVHTNELEDVVQYVRKSGKYNTELGEW